MNHARINSSSSSSAVAAATWWMLMKLLTEARKGLENSSAKRDSFILPEDGYLQLVCSIGTVANRRPSGQQSAQSALRANSWSAFGPFSFSIQTNSIIRQETKTLKARSSQLSSSRWESMLWNICVVAFDRLDFRSLIVVAWQYYALQVWTLSRWALAKCILIPSSVVEHFISKAWRPSSANHNN